MIRAKLLLFVVVFSFAVVPGEVTAQPAASIGLIVRAEKFFRTELYFGRSKPDGSTISEDDWRAFLDETVTPRFPDGFTVVSGNGQYRLASGKIVAEPSQMIIFLYNSRSKRESRTKIEEIRAAYVKKFSQESVMRVDLPKSVNVSF